MIANVVNACTQLEFLGVRDIDPTLLGALGSTKSNIRHLEASQFLDVSTLRTLGEQMPYLESLTASRMSMSIKGAKHGYSVPDLPLDFDIAVLPQLRSFQSNALSGSVCENPAWRSVTPALKPWIEAQVREVRIRWFTGLLSSLSWNHYL